MTCYTRLKYSWIINEVLEEVLGSIFMQVFFLFGDNFLVFLFYFLSAFLLFHSLQLLFCACIAKLICTIIYSHIFSFNRSGVIKKYQEFHLLVYFICYFLYIFYFITFFYISFCFTLYVFCLFGLFLFGLRILF